MTNAARLWHRFLLRGSLMLQIFVWVYIYTYFYYFGGNGTIESATVSLALTYALTQVVTILLTPLSAMGLRHGYRNRMMFSVCAVVAAYAVLLLLPATQGIASFVILMGVYRAFYWAPYRIAERTTSGRNPAWPKYLLALFPLIAGFLLQSGGLGGVMVVVAAAVLAALSIVPLFSMRDAHEGYAWGYRETFHQLYVSSHRHVTLSSISHGIEMALLFTVWPIIVFVLLGGSYALFGMVLSIIFILSMIVRSLVGRPMMRFSAPTRALFVASAWIARLSVVGSIGIILVDVYYYGGSNPASRGHNMLSHEHSADNTTYVDEYTVLKEISMAIGRLIMALVIALLVSNMSATYAFALVFFTAAIVAAGSIFLTEKSVRV